MSTVLNIAFKNGTQKRKDKAMSSSFKVQTVINSEEFKKRVLKTKFTSNQGLTSKQIYELIMSGKEKLSPIENYSWDFQLSFYTKRFSKVIGYTYPSITYINLNTAIFDKISESEIGGNLAHEYCHKLGFNHKNAKELTSVPYAIGYIVRDLIKEMV